MDRISTFIFRFNELITRDIFLRLFTILLFRDFFSGCNVDVFRNHFLSWFFNRFIIVDRISTFVFRFNEFITRNIFLRLFTVFLFRNFFSSCDVDVFRNHFLSWFFRISRFFRFLQTTRCYLNNSTNLGRRFWCFWFLRFRCFRWIFRNLTIIRYWCRWFWR